MKLLMLVISFSLMLASAASAQLVYVGEGDVNADSIVDLLDVQRMVGCLNGPGATSPPDGCDQSSLDRADADNDHDVDLEDFHALLDSFGEAYFNYGVARENLEAEMLAMEASGELRAPDDLYDRILNDLGLIRATYPQLVNVVDDPDYEPDQLIVDLVPGQSLGEYKELNRFYQVIDQDVLFGTTYVLTFCNNLNAPVLAVDYTLLAAVNYAEPNGFVGSDDQIEVTPMGDTYRYSIDDGFLDCFDGCDCHRYWEIDVTGGGEVVLIDYSEAGFPWCEF